eukprot:941502-Pelagomonas_calceolata.AAC.2
MGLHAARIEARIFSASSYASGPSLIHGPFVTHTGIKDVAICDASSLTQHRNHLGGHGQLQPWGCSPLSCAMGWDSRTPFGWSPHLFYDPVADNA